MEVARTIEDARLAVRRARQAGRSVHLVPTMGALHEGHMSLIRAARAPGRFVAVSIFVNPTQFGPGEDLEKYPRPVEADLALCRSAGVDLVFMPSPEQMYPEGFATSVHVAGLTDGLCGPHRPGHFDGVATVVTKLFNIIQPDTAYFGQKDAQQAAVIRRMTEDLNLPIEIVVCPTVRERDGLALSSRNVYLSPGARRQAVCLSEALRLGERMIRAGQTDSAKVIEAMRTHITSAGPCSIDYVEIVDPRTLRPVSRLAGPCMLAVAVRIEGTRLIDNVVVE